LARGCGRSRDYSGLIPLMLVLFQQISISPLANGGDSGSHHRGAADAASIVLPWDICSSSLIRHRGVALLLNGYERDASMLPKSSRQPPGRACSLRSRLGVRAARSARSGLRLFCRRSLSRRWARSAISCWMPPGSRRAVRP
jgi:hypothetical protein